MRKLLAILAMMLFFGCSSAREPCKAPTPVPPPAPSQEEVLEKAKARAEAEGFAAWWEVEVAHFQIYLTKNLGIPVSIEVIEAGFLDDFNFAVLQATMTTPIRTSTIYIICSRPHGQWKIHSLIIKELIDGTLEPKKPELEGEDDMEASNNVYKL